MLLSPSSQACTCIKESRLQTNLFAFSIRFTKAGGGVGGAGKTKQNKKSTNYYFLVAFWLGRGGEGEGEGVICSHPHKILLKFFK